MFLMDRFSGYNQIKMYPNEKKHTSFRIPLGVYCYTMMPFGLKNTREIYQRAMEKIFRPHPRKIVECYVDDIVVISRAKNDHLTELEEVFSHAASPTNDEPH